jgi:hypothetical protein
MRTLLALVLLSSPAIAQERVPCGPTGPFEAAITAQHGETPVGAGMTETGYPLIIFANPVSGSFSVAMRRPDRITCIIQSGRGYTVIEPEKPGENL